MAAEVIMRRRGVRPISNVVEKITRATFLYMNPRDPEEKFAQCATCVHFIADRGRCEWFNEKVTITPGKSCGFYVPGTNAVGSPCLDLISPDEAGLVDRQVRCDNCVFFDPDTEPQKHCDLYTQLNEILPGVFDLDRYVQEDACCNAQTPGERDPAVFGPFGPIPHGQGEKTADSLGLISQGGDPPIKSSGVALMAPGDEFLFLRRSSMAGDHQGEWSWPGGGIEQNETPQQAAVREVAEEIGYVIDPETLGPVASVYGGFNTYTFPVEETFIPALLGTEHDDYVWARMEEAPVPLHPGVKLFFNLAAAALGEEDNDTGVYGPTTGDEVVDYTRDSFTEDGNYFAPITIGKKRKLMPNGTLLIEDCGIARTGTMLYTTRDLPNLQGDEKGHITVERSEEEVFHPDTIASFNGVPVTLFHPPCFVTPENWKQYSTGHVHNVRRGEGPDSDLLKGDIIIEDAAAINYANLHLPDLSCGYDAAYKQIAPGRASQHTIRGNHAAMVPKGRAGRRCAITDEDTTSFGDPDMSKPSLFARTRAYLQGKGLPEKDIQAAQELFTQDSAAEPGSQSTNDGAPPWAQSIVNSFNAMDAKVSAVAAWQQAFDQQAAAAAQAVKDQAARDKATKDEEEKKRKDMEEGEKTGDTLLEAESVPEGVITLGKVWNGLTGDQAIQEVNSLSEILAPGSTKVSREMIAGTRGVALANHMRQVLATRATTDAETVTAFVMDGTPIAKLSGPQLAGVFKAAAGLARIKANSAMRGVAAPRVNTSDGKSGSVSSVVSYKQTMDNYAKEKAGGSAA